MRQRIRALRGRLAAAVLAAALVVGGTMGALVATPSAAAGITVTVDYLAPAYVTAGEPVPAEVEVHASAPVTASVFGVAVRDSAGHNLDFPQAATNVSLTTTTYQYQSGRRAFGPGQYTMFPSWKDQGGRWHPLQKVTLTVGDGAAPSTPPPTPTPTPSPTPVTGGGAPAHVVVAVMENWALSDWRGNSSAPYFSSLISQGTLYTDDTGKSHPSLPNYLDLYSGSTQGQAGNDNCGLGLTAPNLGTEAAAAGISLKGYFQGLAGGDSNYVCRHNALAQFSDAPSKADQADFSAWPSDYSTLPAVSFVVPDIANDAGDNGSIGTGDAWLKAHLDGYAQWAKTHNSVLMVVGDEADSDSNLTTPVPLVAVGQGVPTGATQAGHVTHDSLLRTIEDWYGLKPLADSAAASALPGLTGAGGTPTPTPTATATSTPTVPAGAVQPTWDPHGSHPVTLDEEFNGPLNTSLWTAGWGAASGVTPPVNSQESECYDSSQVTVSGGELHLTAVPLTAAEKTGPCAGKAYKSGIVTTDPSVLGTGRGFQQAHGAVEFRADIPADPKGGCANWPALWTDGQAWPQDGEIDVYECLGNPSVQGSGDAEWHLHSAASGGAADGPGGGGTGAYTGWHTFGASWGPSSVTFYYDGKSVGSALYTVSSPNYLILNLATGFAGGYTDVPASGSTVDVDWVHVWGS